MAPRKRYIARTDTPTQSLLFYTKGNELTIEHTVKDNPQEGCNYYFSTSNKDWFDATKLHHALLNHINKEHNSND